MKLDTKKKPTVRSFCQHPLADIAITLDDKKVESVCRWKADPFPMELWSQVVAFFKDSPNDEVQVRIYYNKQAGIWRAHAHPQSGHGLQTKELPDHTDAGVRPDASDPNFTLVGTIHSHCQAAAFQSGTDETNEVSQDGVHITIGKITSPRLDLHARCYFQEWKFDISWSELFGESMEPLPEIPESFRTQAVTDAMREAANKRHLDRYFEPVASPFPEVWKQNVIPVVSHAVVSGGYSGNGNAVTHGSYGSHGYYSTSFKPEVKEWIANLILQNPKISEGLISILAQIIETACKWPTNTQPVSTIWDLIGETMSPDEINSLSISHSMEWNRKRALQDSVIRLHMDSAESDGKGKVMQTALTLEERIHKTIGAPIGHKDNEEEIEALGAEAYADIEWSTGRMTVQGFRQFLNHYNIFPELSTLRDMEETDSAAYNRSHKQMVLQEKSMDAHMQAALGEQ